MTQLAMLYDSSRCTACRGCQVACKQWNDLPAERTVNTGSYENPPNLSTTTFTRVRFIEEGTSDAPKFLFLVQGCMHCTDAGCVTVCPTQALKHHPSGAVTFERDRCNGCGYCSQACPFDVPRLEANLLTGYGKSSKCHLCQDRITNGEVPACVKTCPAASMSFGEQSRMVEKGRQRVELLKSNGYADANLYGDTLLGGLHRMCVLTEKPEVYGLPTDPRPPILTGLWQDVVQGVGPGALGLGMLGVAGMWIISRRSIKMQEVDSVPTLHLDGGDEEGGRK